MIYHSQILFLTKYYNLKFKIISKQFEVCHAKICTIIEWKFLQNIPMSIHLLTNKQTIPIQTYKQYSVTTFHNTLFDKASNRRKALTNILGNGRKRSWVVSSQWVGQLCTTLCSSICFHFGLEHTCLSLFSHSKEFSRKVFCNYLKAHKIMNFEYHLSIYQHMEKIHCNRRSMNIYHPQRDNKATGVRWQYLTQTLFSSSLVHKKKWIIQVPLKRVNCLYNLYHSPASSVLGTSSTHHCKIDFIIITMGTWEDACKHFIILK
jgi:hypothetical protein